MNKNYCVQTTIVRLTASACWLVYIPIDSKIEALLDLRTVETDVKLDESLMS